MKHLLLTFSLVLATGTAQAQKVYKVVRPDGTILFTDSPSPGDDAEQVDVAPLNTFQPLASPTDAFDDTPAVELEQSYSEIRITSPGNDESIRDNAGNVNVDLSLKPSLRSGDKIDLMLDGESIGGGKSTAITLSDMGRGTHNIQAVVKNSAGQVIARSNSVTFTLQRRSRRLPIQPVQPGSPIVPVTPGGPGAPSSPGGGAPVSPGAPSAPVAR